MNPTHEHAGRVPLAGPVGVAADELRFAFVASGGPGGQNVNKRATKCELRVRIAALTPMTDAARDRLRTAAGARLTQDDELLIIRQEQRSQGQNREAALAELRQLVAGALVRPKRRIATKPTRGSVQRRLDAKRRTSERKSNRSERD